MRGLLKTVVTIYVISKVAPVIIKGVVYVTDGAMTGIANKIVKDIDKVIFGEEDAEARILRRGRKNYRDYSTGYTRYKDEA